MPLSLRAMAWQMSLKIVQGDEISLGIEWGLQESADCAVLCGLADVASDALWNRCERFFGTHAMPAILSAV